jgi:hypothetical protein
MCEITNYTKCKKVDFGNLILKYDVIHDALKVMCNKKLQRIRNFGTGRN